MMRNVFRVILAAVFSMFISVTAGAQSYDDLIQYHDPLPEDMGAGGNYYSCMAKGSWGGNCVDCVDTIRGKECAGVRYSRACQCDPSTCKPTGYCSYQP